MSKEHLEYVLYDINNDKYYRIEKLDEFLELEDEIITSCYKSLYNQIMYAVTLQMFIDKDLLVEEDIQKAKDDLHSIPINHLLFTQELLEGELEKRMGKKKFKTMKKECEQEFLTTAEKVVKGGM